MKLLTVENAKTVKGEKLGYLTGILYLAPAESSGVRNVCPYATAECRRMCLNTAGLGGVFKSVQRARVQKTRWLTRDRQGFLRQLASDVLSLQVKASKLGMIPAVRINGTSDLPELAQSIASQFPTVQFYDYTKIPMPWKRVRSNYHVTFSYSGHNLENVREALEHGVNVAVVFAVKRGQPLPKTWKDGARVWQVVDGDTSDLRFLDPKPVIIGLRAKGKARKAKNNPFVILS